MTLLAATWFDAGLVVFHAAVLIAIAAYFRGERRREATPGGARPTGWAATAVSLAAIFLPWTTLGQLAGDAYELGTRLWLAPIGVFLAAAAVAWFLAPLAQRLGGVDASQYLELRFGPTARRGALLLHLGLRGALAAALLAWSARQAGEGAGGAAPAWLIVVAAGTVATACAVLGGRRGLAWIDAWQGVVVCLGVLVLLVAVWSQPGVSADSISETARKLGRGPAFDPSFTAPDGWTLAAAFPAYLLACVAWFGIDAGAQTRWIVAGNTADAQRGLFFGGAVLAALAAATVYLGSGLLDFYQHHPEALRGRWVANVDGLTRRSLTDPATRRRPFVDPRTGETRRSLLDDETTPALDPTDGTPLLDWYADEVRGESLERLVGERRLLRPNNQTPVESVDELLDPATGRFNPERLALRRPTEGREVLLHRRATGELLGWFIRTRLPWGLSALAWCALLAAGVSATATTAAAAGAGSGDAGHGGADSGGAASGGSASDLRAAAVGGGIVGLGLLLLVGDQALPWIAPLASLALGPLLVAFLLGLTTRRGSAATAFAGMLACFAVTAAIWGAARATGGDLQPPVVHPLWALPAGVAAGWLFGALAGLATPARSRGELRGLTLGCGPLGVRSAHSGAGAASDFFLSGSNAPPVVGDEPPRWRE